jgi:hypothetical protein
VPSRHEPTRELRELLIKRTFPLGSAKLSFRLRKPPYDRVIQRLRQGET